MGELWALRGDPNTHGGGNLIAQNPQTVFIKGISVIEHGDPASPDSFCPKPGGPHCNPATAGGSGTVFVYGNPVHRNRDPRICGALTKAGLQTTVFCG